MEILIENLHKSYRDAAGSLTVIKALSTTFPAKGSVAIIGKSGVGKSTLLHMLGGLDRPTQGHIFYDGTDLTTLKGDALSNFRARQIGFIFQFHHLLLEFTTLENVSMPLIIAGESEYCAQKEARSILSQLELSHRLEHRPGELSGGEQQRVAIARAIVAKPAVILADEPTGNLDAATGKTVQALLREINNSLDNLFIIVTHNRELAQSMDIVLEMLPGGELRAL